MTADFGGHAHVGNQTHGVVQQSRWNLEEYASLGPLIASDRFGSRGDAFIGYRTAREPGVLPISESVQPPIKPIAINGDRAQAPQAISSSAKGAS